MFLPFESRGTDVTESNGSRSRSRGIKREERGTGDRMKNEKKSTRVVCNRSIPCIIRKRRFGSSRDDQSALEPLFDL